MPFLLDPDESRLTISANKAQSSENSKAVTMGFMFCNPVISPGVKCASRADSINYLDAHKFMVNYLYVEKYIDYEDYETPFKIKDGSLAAFNATDDKMQKSWLEVKLTPNNYVIDDNILGIPGIGARPQNGTYLTVD